MSKTIQEVQQDKKAAEEAINAVIWEFIKANPGHVIQLSADIIHNEFADGKITTIRVNSHLNIII